jgi:hypothetical protein
MEKFKDIPNYKGLYQVSNLGRVKSLKRKNVRMNRLLKPSLRKGYFKVTLCKNGQQKAFDIHQLVAIAFLNHKPNNYVLVVDHIDNKPLNNNVENLQIITHRKNTSKDRKGGSSKYVGVCWRKQCKKWDSRIQLKGIRKYLGLFTDEHMAHLAYEKALKEII